MKLFIKPTFDNVREDLGYDEFEDVDEDAILFQQGIDGDFVDVEDGESFEIPEGHLADIEDEEPYYMLIETFDGSWDKEEIYDELEPGRYVLNGNVIKRIGDPEDFN